ncbi:MAG: hypothetical protein KDJ29_11935 [Hyphomicrobiales bacterium]|nr:hypothetical protein [Hyphomicrobiales bacterium]
MIASARNLLNGAMIAAGLALVAGPAGAATVSCKAFMTHMQTRVADLKPQFVRPVIVSRGGALFGNEVHDLITNLRVDGQLFCDGDRFVRFEMKVHAPFAAKLLTGAHRIELAAASFKMRWPENKAAATLRRMRANAAEYLRASAQRGDVVVSGKIEEHAGEAGDVALVWTRSDRTFILVEYRP